MEKRTFKRVPANLEAKFMSENSTYNAIVKNCSENGLCIKTSNCLSYNKNVEIYIPLKKEDLHLHVMIKRIVKVDDYNYEIGFALLNPPKNYLEFVETLRNIYDSLNDFSVRWFVPHFYQE